MRALDCSRVKKRLKSKSTLESFPADKSRLFRLPNGKRPAAEMEGIVSANASIPPNIRMGENKATP
ncbi:Uncharacterized protein APZ42_016694 [Daphnia magna]|uniref:Uncharacterized protein n=1 Tax=Daphnia magna TaxID=35525 RepID=A0A165A3C8_9CRUS|nr:Uncharacterized protein APZ42_016694 [Daphnia magna]